MKKQTFLFVATLLCMASLVSFGQEQVNLADKLQEKQLKAVNRSLSPYGDSKAVEMNAAEGSGLAILSGTTFES